MPAGERFPASELQELKGVPRVLKHSRPSEGAKKFGISQPRRWDCPSRRCLQEKVGAVVRNLCSSFHRRGKQALHLQAENDGSAERQSADCSSKETRVGQRNNVNTVVMGPESGADREDAEMFEGAASGLVEPGRGFNQSGNATCETFVWESWYRGPHGGPKDDGDSGSTRAPKHEFVGEETSSSADASAGPSATSMGAPPR